MSFIMNFLREGSWEPIKQLLDLLTLPAERTWEWFGLLGAFMVLCELTRLSLGTILTRSVLAHVVRCLLTFPVQALVLAAVLVWADYHHPERSWINLGFALVFYAVWYGAGQLVLLARPDTEGADPGFMTVGALITFPVGIVAALGF
jgi:hypothetical protein